MPRAEQRLISEDITDGLNPLPLGRTAAPTQRDTAKDHREHEATRLHPDHHCRNL
jgi:hypothetical protein